MPKLKEILKEAIARKKLEQAAKRKVRLQKNVDVHTLLRANLKPQMNKNQDIMVQEIAAKLTKLMDKNKVSLDSLKLKMAMLLRPISA